MNYKYITNRIGDSVRLPYGDSGESYCPICAENLHQLGAYYENGTPSEEICPGCNIQFGDDDIPTRISGAKSTEDYFQYVRIGWLNENGWDQLLINRLQAVLGLNIQELKERGGQKLIDENDDRSGQILIDEDDD